MSNKRYSNKGVNSAAKAQATAAAAQEGKRQTLIVCLVAVAVVLVAIILALALGGKNITSTDGNGTQGGSTTTSASASTTDPTKLNADMTAIKAEIDSMAVADFTETTETTEYVKLTIKHYGDVVIRLRPDIAPITVANFQKLVGEGFYNGLTFHRIMQGFMIQGGDPKSRITAGCTIEFNSARATLSVNTRAASTGRLSIPST